MEETESMTAGQIANHTFAYLRRIESKIERIDSQVRTVTEILLRHETRLGRIERDVGELKSDLVMIGNQILNRINEILGVTRKIDEHADRIAALEISKQPQV
jgi:hypothetical protein